MNQQAVFERVDGLLLVGLVLPTEALLVHQVVIFMTETTNCSHLHKRPFLCHLGKIKDGSKINKMYTCSTA